MYLSAAEAQAYYSKNNPEITSRMSYLEKYGMKNSKVKFHRVPSGIFSKLVKQVSQYLLSNGVTLDQEVKKKLGRKFDIQLQKGIMGAMVDGVNYGFFNAVNDKPELKMFRATEFIPLLDEYTGVIKLGIRFWQLDEEKPLNIEIYDDKKITFISKDKDGYSKPIKQAYKIKTIKAEALETTLQESGYSTVPVIPLYANETKQSEFNSNIKALIDAYDFVLSDFVDGVTLVDGVYWYIKNYQGNDVEELIKEIQQLKATYSDDESDAQGKSLESPYQGKKELLSILKRQIYDDFMGLDKDQITGGSLTNVAIKVAEIDIGLKADILEWQLLDFLDDILELLDYKGEAPTFKRRTMINDTEMIENISTMLADGYIDNEFAIKHNPLIPDDEQEKLLKRIDEKETKLVLNRYPLGSVNLDGQST